MTDVDTNPNSPDPNALDVGAEGGNTDVDTLGENTQNAELSLNDLNLVTGREYSSRDEALKHLKELNSLVGDQEISKARKQADEFNEILDNYSKAEGISREEAKAELAKPSEKTPEETEETELSRLRKQLNNETQARKQREFITDVPLAKDYIDTLQARANTKDESLTEAWENSGLADLVKEPKAQPTQNPTLNATPRSSKGYSAKMNQLAKAVKENPSADNKTALVDEFVRQTG